MLTLPSGRRVGFSLDRFHALLAQMDSRRAKEIVASLDDPDDLLFVLDAVHFSLEDGSPYFADYVASDWTAYAADWSTADRRALHAWLQSDEARTSRAAAIDYMKALLRYGPSAPVPYPYEVVAHAGVHPGSRLRQ